MIKFGKLQLPSKRMNDEVGTSIYGWICESGIIEAFATHPSACGTSDARLGAFHLADDVEEISQARFNAAFLVNPSEDELDPDERTMSLGELMMKYPVED